MKLLTWISLICVVATRLREATESHSNEQKQDFVLVEWHWRTADQMRCNPLAAPDNPVLLKHQQKMKQTEIKAEALPSRSYNQPSSTKQTSQQPQSLHYYWLIRNAQTPLSWQLANVWQRTGEASTKFSWNTPIRVSNAGLTDRKSTLIGIFKNHFNGMNTCSLLKVTKNWSKQGYPKIKKNWFQKKLFSKCRGTLPKLSASRGEATGKLRRTEYPTYDSGVTNFVKGNCANFAIYAAIAVFPDPNESRPRQRNGCVRKI